MGVPARKCVCVSGVKCSSCLAGWLAGRRLSAKVSVTGETGWNTADQKAPAEVLTLARRSALACQL